MDIKEFRSNEAAKTEQQPAYTDGSANGSVNYKVYALIGIIAALIVIIIAVFIKANKFDIKEYIKPVYTGANGYASVTFVIDEDGLSAKLLGKNPDGDRQYYVEKFIESLSAHTDAADIKNGDTVDVVIEYNEAYADGAKADIPHSEYSYKAKGITDGAVIDIYSGVSIAFTGISPDAKIVVSNEWEDDYLKTLTFSESKAEGIVLGDTVTIMCDTSYEELARHGIIARSMEMSCTADMLSSYCESKDDINSDLMKTIYSEISDTIKEETEDVTYRMLFAATGNTDYLYHLNEEKADNIKIEAAYFLDRKAEADSVSDRDSTVVRNYIVVEASADISDNEGSEQVYFMFAYTNAYVTIDGTFNVGHDNQNKRFSCSTNEQNLYDEYVGDLKNNYTIDKIK
mgnify:FL=1